MKVTFSMTWCHFVPYVRGPQSTKSISFSLCLPLNVAVPTQSGPGFPLHFRDNLRISQMEFHGTGNWILPWGKLFKIVFTIQDSYKEGFEWDMLDQLQLSKDCSPTCLHTSVYQSSWFPITWSPLLHSAHSLVIYSLMSTRIWVYETFSLRFLADRYKPKNEEVPNNSSLSCFLIGCVKYGDLRTSLFCPESLPLGLTHLTYVTCRCT